MDYLIASAQLVFEGSADTQIFLITERERNFLISFSGFLNTTSDALDKFRCSEIDIYTGVNVPQIVKTTMKRSEDNMTTEHHSFRRFEITPELKQMMVDWMFSAEELLVLE